VPSIACACIYTVVSGCLDTSHSVVACVVTDQLCLPHAAGQKGAPSLLYTCQIELGSVSVTTWLGQNSDSWSFLFPLGLGRVLVCFMVR